MLRTGLSVVIPVLNERPAIDRGLDEIEAELDRLRLDYEIIVVDDASTDGTVDVLRRRSGLRVIENPRNRGYGAAIKRGVRAARHPWVLITDGDVSYPATNLEPLLAAVAACDMVVGARPLDSIRNPASWNRTKVWIQRLLSLWLGSEIPDINSGMRVFRRSLALELEDVLSDAFSYTSGLTVACLRLGRRVGFVPIDYRERVGVSKVRPLSFSAAFLRSVLRALLGRRSPGDEAAS